MAREHCLNRARKVTVTRDHYRNIIQIVFGIADHVNGDVHVCHLLFVRLPFIPTPTANALLPLELTLDNLKTRQRFQGLEVGRLSPDHPFVFAIRHEARCVILDPGQGLTWAQ